MSDLGFETQRGRERGGTMIRVRERERERHDKGLFRLPAVYSLCQSKAVDTFHTLFLSFLVTTMYQANQQTVFCIDHFLSQCSYHDVRLKPKGCCYTYRLFRTVMLQFLGNRQVSPSFECTIFKIGNVFASSFFYLNSPFSSCCVHIRPRKLRRKVWHCVFTFGTPRLPSK